MNTSIENIAQYDLQPGDIVRLGRWYLPLEHCAIYTGNNTFIENRFGSGVIETPVEEFLARYQYFKLLNIYRLHDRNPAEVISRARTLVGKEYRMFNYNCEHFIDEVFNNPQISEQVEQGKRLALYFLISGLVTFTSVSLALKRIKK